MASASPLLPVLIIPGFMSSGLEIQKSSLKPEWEGKRIWINLKSLGFEALLGGSSRHGDKNNKNDEQEEEEALHNEYTNMWLQHMALSLEDQTTEHPGVQVRALKGLKAVDYLTPGALTNHLSYVFGPVIQALLKAGYEEGVNLDAASYDWRLTPMEMEERDAYFTETMHKVEHLYERNDHTPVVLLCHSLGAKVGHYLLSKGEREQPGWCEKYIHTYVSAGGPHLGAPKAIRGIVTGDKMGLDVFLSDEDALVLARSLGSTPWLIPRQLPSGAPPPCFLHRQGVVEIRIRQLVDVTPFLKSRQESSMPTKVKLAVKLGKSVATTDFLPIEGMKVLLEGTFTFATDPEGPSSREALIIAVCEPGVNLARKKKRKERDERCPGCSVPLWLKLLFCWHIVRYSIEWSFRLVGCILNWSLWKFWVSSADIISKATDGSSILMATKPLPMNECSSTTEESDINVDLIDSAPNWKCCRTKKRFTLALRVTWIPPDRRIQKYIRASIANLEDTSSLQSFGRLENTKHKKRVIEACSGYVLLKNEKLDQTLSTIERCYNSDANEPRRRASDDAPPVGRVLAIYGINLPTEVGAVYKRHTSVVERNVTNYCTIDTNARLKSNVENGYVVEKGVVLETRATPQPHLLNDGRCSGDGTVPYYSLQHVRTWSDSCDVTVKELPGADHREILADERFHKILVDYVSSRNNHGIIRGDEAV